MTRLKELYYCKICRNLVEVAGTGGGQLVCCGQGMTLLVANTNEGATEKHVPVVKDLGERVEVTVGSVEHPMNDDHYITFIEVLANSEVYRKELKPGEKPVAEFSVRLADIIEVREFCNLHLLWKT